jgi:hypothetical protein
MTYFNFIGIYDDALSNEQCQIIIDEFENNEHNLMLKNQQILCTILLIILKQQK